MLGKNNEVEHKKPITSVEVARIYGWFSLFVQKLHWNEFQTDSKTILLDGGEFINAKFDIVPLVAEDQSYNLLQDPS